MYKLPVLMALPIIFSLSIARPIESGNDTYIDPLYVRYCEEIGEAKHISPEFLESFIEAESSGNPNADNGACKGLMQVYESVHRDRMARLGVTDLYDPKGNIEIGSDILIELFETYGDDAAKVVMMYNGQRDAKERAVDWNFTDYANKVLDRARELEIIHGKATQ